MRERKSYTEKYKQAIVKLIVFCGYTTSQIDEIFDVPISTSRGWVGKYELSLDGRFEKAIKKYGTLPTNIKEKYLENIEDFDL